MTAPRIALDAFGGDTCPVPEIDGARLAVEEGHHVVLVGDEAKLSATLGGLVPTGISVVHASEVITMGDSPAKAIRQKTDSSMVRSFGLLKDGEADAVVSAGNSGAMLACGLFKAGRIKGVDRPAICTQLPHHHGYFHLLDAGANVECRPLNLVQFAVLGAVYETVLNGTARPRVGILSNGTEDGKGTHVTRATHSVLRNHASEYFEYVGYVEGDMFRDAADVVVTDGFSGNIALKVAEAAGALIGDLIKNAVAQSLRIKLGAALMKPVFDQIRRISHPDFYGGAPLLGVKQLVIICHGSSSPRTIATAVAQASSLATKELTPRLTAAVESSLGLFDAAKAAEDESETRT